MRTPAQDKWDAENMAYQTVKVKKTLLDSFKAACDARGDRVNTVLREAMEDYVAQRPKKRSSYRHRTEEQRQAFNQYQRRYRAEHKYKVRKWQDNYIIRKAEKLAAAKEE